MAKEAWAPTRKKGESDTSYKKKYYSAQREHAEETGDQKTVDKIYSKAGKQSHLVDSNATDKAALGTFASVMGTRGLGRIAGAAKGAKAIGETKAIGVGKSSLRSGASKAVGSRKPLPGGKGMAREAESPTAMKNVTPKAKGRVSGVLKRGKTESYHTRPKGSVKVSPKSASVGKKGEGYVKEIKKGKKNG